MGRGRRGGDDATRRDAPIPLEPVDLLAGLAPGVELCADDLPPGIGPDLGDGATSATATVAETGRLIRAGDTTVRRLIRGPLLSADEPPVSRSAEVDRAGVPPRTPDRPGE